MSDEIDLQELQSAISRVLEGEAGRLRLHDHIDGKIRLDREMWSKAAELGWLALGLPEAHGGLDAGPGGLDALYREIGAMATPGPFTASLAAAQALAEVADPDTCAEWLPSLAAGERKLAVAAQVHGGAGGRDAWLLGDADSDAALVPLDGERWGLVALKGAAPVEIWDRTRTVVSIDLSDAQAIVTLPGDATKRALSRHLALAVAGDSIGGARAIVEKTIGYMKEREQFGRPIASFQALKHRVADLMTAVVSGEEIVSLAVEALASGDPDAEVWTNLAKARVTQSYVEIASDCLQLHGGVGFTWEFDVHVYLNRAWLNEMLVAPNAQLKDAAAVGLADAWDAGRTPLELAL